MKASNVHRVPEKKQATLIFAINSPSVEIFFTIFEAFCSGIIHARHNIAYIRKGLFM